jgi:hypothetical protein
VSLIPGFRLKKQQSFGHSFLMVDMGKEEIDQRTTKVKADLLSLPNVAQWPEQVRWPHAKSLGQRG